MGVNPRLRLAFTRSQITPAADVNARPVFTLTPRIAIEVLQVDVTNCWRKVRIRKRSFELVVKGQELGVQNHRLPWVSSRIRRAEALRAALTWSPGRMADTRRLLNTVTSLSVDLLCDSAGLVPAAPGRWLATLDALHLATAISLGGDLHSLLTYDQQLRDAALGHNLSVASPI